MLLAEPLPGPLGPIQTIKADVSQFLRVTLERHRRGEDAFRVVHGLSDGIDAILRYLFLQKVADGDDSVALVAVGGYGRRELCPHSDIDLLILRDGDSSSDAIQQLVRLLWDGGFQLGHSVRTPAECYEFMSQDHVTAATMIEHRFICGSTRLYESFVAAVNRFRKRRGEAFARKKLEHLHGSLLGSDRTIWVLEPHMKDGSCTLRDVQRVLWVENIRRGHGTFDALARGGNFDPRDVQLLRDAYRFYLRVRCELHFTNGIKQDVLEREGLLEVSRNMGYRGEPRETVEGLLTDYFRHAKNVSRFLRLYLETGTRGRRFFSKLSHKFFRSPLKPYLQVDRQILFPSEDFEDVLPQDEPALAEEVLDIFLLAQREGYRLSESLSRALREIVRGISFDFSRSRVVNACFVEILKGVGVGRILKAMHRTGVLSRVIPEFRAIDGTVNLGGFHQFTVDEHTLRTLETLDRAEAGDESVPEEFRQAAERIRDFFPLRLALLLHDVGKGLSDRDHSISGAEAAGLVCERLALESEVIDSVEFLIYRHLSMFRVSETRDYSEAGVVEAFARVVETERRLDMLYLLTYCDVTSVGPGTWTVWKSVQLSELHKAAAEFLRGDWKEHANVDEILDASRLGAEDRAAVAAHAAEVGSAAYVREFVPERMLEHAGLVARYLETKEVQTSCEDFREYQEIALCAKDRPHLFADFSGVLFAEGFNLLGGRIFSRSDGVALDVFYVEVADDVRIDVAKRLESVRSKLQRIEAKEMNVQDLIRAWVRSYRFRRVRRRGLGLYSPSVSFDNQASPECTVVEVVAADRPGLLYDLASAISDLALDVRNAKVSTLADRCRDSFWIVEADGQKVTNPARMKEIELTLAGECQTSSSALSQGGLSIGSA